MACGGTWMVKKDLIEGEKWDEITRICKDAVKTMLGFELGHVGINCQDAGQAEQTAKACVPSSALSTRPATPPTSPAPLWSATRPPAAAPTATSPSAPTMWTAPSTTWAFRA